MYNLKRKTMWLGLVDLCIKIHDLRHTKRRTYNTNTKNKNRSDRHRDRNRQTKEEEKANANRTENKK